jgi:hypothetical protein
MCAARQRLLVPVMRQRVRTICGRRHHVRPQSPCSSLRATLIAPNDNPSPLEATGTEANLHALTGPRANILLFDRWTPCCGSSDGSWVSTTTNAVARAAHTGMRPGNVEMTPLEPAACVGHALSTRSTGSRIPTDSMTTDISTTAHSVLAPSPAFQYP